MAEVEVLQDAAVLVNGDRIEWVGPRKQAPTSDHVVELSGVIFPGFIDCHTHAVFGAPRLDDHERRALGVEYKAIAAAGGGILQSVRDVRARSDADLEALTRARLRTLMANGATTIEVKSGYGLELEAELKQLRVIKRLAAELPVTLVPTFLGAHEVPPEYRGKREAYVRLVCEEMIPAVARERLAQCCDVFCEPGVFSCRGEPADPSRWRLRVREARGEAHADTGWTVQEAPSWRPSSARCPPIISRPSSETGIKALAARPAVDRAAPRDDGLPWQTRAGAGTAPHRRRRRRGAGKRLQSRNLADDEFAARDDARRVTTRTASRGGGDGGDDQCCRRAWTRFRPRADRPRMRGRPHRSGRR
jgi:hypothetical protein